ncbi:GNAT family N-acetyltransferase [Halobacillus litoralis]|uniref:GNAT family N-acetyltransferase n=1 Tax=Halobacillus litoralis TaxID=45668 RepID=A0A845DRR4_9BACI|nr:GNAT family N-acetyltransferase [Halobacillus litoralis]
MEINTERLRIFPVTLDLAQTLMKNSLAFYYQYQLPWNKNWPHDGLKAMLPIYTERLENNAGEMGFGPWVMINAAGEHVIGDIGFKGSPDEDGNIEIGYHVVASERNAGYASEAVGELCRWAFTKNGVEGIEAQCDKGNIPSQKVLINNGFSHTGRSQDILVFKKEKARNDHKQNSYKAKE